MDTMDMEHDNSSGSVQKKLPDGALQQLEIFTGKWKIEGKNFPVAPENPEVPVHGEDHYEWLAGRFYLVSRWQHLAGTGGHEGISILGFDEEEKKLFTRNYDNLGYERKYWLEYEDNRWKFIGNQERAVRKFSSDDNSYTEHWEMKNGDGQWVPLCIMKGTKLA